MEDVNSLECNVISSVESQNGFSTVKQCSAENQKGTITIDIVQHYYSALLVLNITSLNTDSALLALN